MLKKILWWVPSLVMMAVIFRLSTDTGEESSSLSGIFTGFLGMSEFLIRKLAHVTEYFILTLTLFLGLRKGIGTGTKNTLIFMFVIAVIYACSDELHQTFVGGRSGRPLDVLIDSKGIVLAVLICGIDMKKTGKKESYGQ